MDCQLPGLHLSVEFRQSCRWIASSLSGSSRWVSGVDLLKAVRKTSHYPSLSIDGHLSLVWTVRTLPRTGKLAGVCCQTYNRTTRGKVNIWQTIKFYNTTIRKPGISYFSFQIIEVLCALWCSILNVLLSHSVTSNVQCRAQGNSFSPSISLPNAKVVETQWRLFLWIESNELETMTWELMT